MNGNDLVCDELTNGICFEIKIVTDSVFSKASDLYYKHETLHINSSDGVCAGVCF